MVETSPSNWFAAVVQTADMAILWYMFLVNSFFALLLVLAAPQLFAHWRFSSEDVLARSLTSLAAILMEEVSFRRYRRASDSLRLVLFAFIEPFGYRQLTVWYRLKAFVRYLQDDHSWGRMMREGFRGPPPAASPRNPAVSSCAVTPGTTPTRMHRAGPEAQVPLEDVQTLATRTGC